VFYSYPARTHALAQKTNAAQPASQPAEPSTMEAAASHNGAKGASDDVMYSS